MSNLILIISGNTLLTYGLTAIIRREYPDFVVRVLQKVEYISEDAELILDSAVLQEPKHLSLQKLYKHYNSPGMLLFHPGPPDDGLQIYLKGWFDMGSSEDEILSKLRKLLETSSKAATGISKNSVLSDREIEVLRYVALGLTNKEISDELCISAHTVITHRKNITAKLGIKTIAGLAVYAVINSIISAEEMES